MNSLSWLIYAAEVANALKAILGTLGVLSMMVLPILLVFRGMAASHLYESDMPSGDNPLGSTEYQSWCALKKMTAPRFWVPWLIIVGLVFIFTPSSRTLYMIAASEAGEVVATSDEAAEIMDGLRAIIKKRIADEVGP